MESCRHAVTRLALALIVIGVLLRGLAAEHYDVELGNFALVFVALGTLALAPSIHRGVGRFLDGAR